MSKNLIVDGNTYTGVQKIEALDSNTNEYVQFVDTSDANATTNDIKLGKTAYVDGSKITGSYESDVDEDAGCLFIDYDGTELHKYSVSEALALTTLPSNPVHTGLTAQGWNWTLQEIQSYLTSYPDAMVVVGQTYITDDSTTRIHISLTDGFLSPNLYLSCGVGTSVSISWGDSSTDSASYDSNISGIMAQHTYVTSGNYIISIQVISGSINLTGKYDWQNSIYNSLIFTPPSDRTKGDLAYLLCITEIHIGSNADIIGGCTHLYNLRYITAPKIVASIQRAYEKCYSLESVTITRNQSHVDPHAFSESNVVYISLPPSINNFGVTAFPTSDYFENFYNCRRLKYLTIPGVVNDIKGRFASGCSSLRRLVIPGVTSNSIANSAFSGCYSLNKVILSGGITTLGTSCFYNCRDLRYVDLGSNITNIPQQCFRYCYSLKTIVGIENVTSFGSNCLRDCPVDFTLNNSCTSIESYALEGCFNISDIDIPDTVSTLGTGAFYDCYNAKTLSLGHSITSIPDGAFSNCSSLREVIIPSECITIGNSSFYNCYSINGVSLPSGLTSIGENCFYNCYCLKSITIPSSVTAIGSMAFYNCAGMSELIWNAINCTTQSSSQNSIFKGAPIKKAIFGQGVEVVPAYILDRCETLSYADIPNSVTTIGDGAFSYCSNLTSITIPDSVTSIGWYAFQDCSSLTSITIPDSVTSIGEWAFRTCSSLTSISISNSITSIGLWTFGECSGITDIIIPNSVQSIGLNAFSGCSRLSSVVIGSGVLQISNGAFSNNTSASVMKFLNTNVASVTTSSFSNIPATCAFVVPFVSYASYSAAANYPTTNYGMIGFGTYEIGETLPTTDQTSSWNAVWYATITDAKTQTNPITVGNGNEVYCRCTAVS